MIRAARSSLADTPQELPSRFIPTPERLAPYLSQKDEEIMTQLGSVEGREQVFQELLKHEEELRKVDPSFNPESLRRDLDLVSETLDEKQKFVNELEKPERKGIVRRTFGHLKNFAKKHPVVTVLLMAAAAVAVVGGAAYAAGGIELLLAKLGIEGISNYAESAKRLGKVIEGTFPNDLPAA
jgi:HD superfamily phosphohydrolase